MIFYVIQILLIFSAFNTEIYAATSDLNDDNYYQKGVDHYDKGEFKKSTGRTFSFAGHETNDVRCLPKSAKPASQQMKDRKSSIKRWRKIRTNPVKMSKMKLRRKMTKKLSKKVR